MATGDATRASTGCCVLLDDACAAAASAGGGSDVLFVGGVFGAHACWWGSDGLSGSSSVDGAVSARRSLARGLCERTVTSSKRRKRLMQPMATRVAVRTAERRRVPLRARCLAVPQHRVAMATRLTTRVRPVIVTNRRHADTSRGGANGGGEAMGMGGVPGDGGGTVGDGGMEGGSLCHWVKLASGSTLTMASTRVAESRERVSISPPAGRSRRRLGRRTASSR